MKLPCEKYTPLFLRELTLTHYPSVCLLLAYTAQREIVEFSSAYGTLRGLSSSTFSQSPAMRYLRGCGMRDLGWFLLRTRPMSYVKKMFYDMLAACAVLLFFIAGTLILTYFNVSHLWEPFVLEHLTHQDLTTAK